MRIHIFRTKEREQGKGTRPELQATFMSRLSNDPFLDWAIILAIGVVCMSALVAGGAYVYLGTGDALDAAKSAAAPAAGRLPLDVQALSRALSAATSQASLRNAIVRGYAAPSDPSLP